MYKKECCNVKPESWATDQTQFAERGDELVISAKIRTSTNTTIPLPLPTPQNEISSAKDGVLSTAVKLRPKETWRPKIQSNYKVGSLLELRWTATMTISETRLQQGQNGANPQLRKNPGQTALGTLPGPDYFSGIAGDNMLFKDRREGGRHGGELI